MQEAGFHVAAAQFPEQEQLKCPRCESANTKFCYYNNYNLSQPRHFCKNCRRYWTKGGALRNIPVGGGSRKPSAAAQKRPSPSSSVADAAPTKRAPPPTARFADPAEVPAGGFSSLLQGTEAGADSGRVGEGFWAAGAWPDLAIYTPGSSFHQ